MNKLDPQVKAIWAFRIFLKFFFIGLIILLAEIIFVPSHWDFMPPSGVIGLSIIVLALLMALIWPPLMYRFWAFDIREQEMYIERGVITRIHTTAPYTRIQHLDVRQGVFERMFGLASLVVYTAGTRGADIEIPGLPRSYAEQLRDSLKNYSPEDAV